jgi:hypothetical protein
MANKQLGTKAIFNSCSAHENMYLSEGGFIHMKLMNNNNMYVH